MGTKFTLTGVAAMAAEGLSFPVDMTKTRMQLAASAPGSHAPNPWEYRVMMTNAAFPPLVVIQGEVVNGKAAPTRGAIATVTNIIKSEGVVVRTPTPAHAVRSSRLRKADGCPQPCLV